MSLLARNNRQFVSHWKRKPFHLSHVQLSTTKVGNAGNSFQYEEVIKNFKWKVPEHWNFAQVNKFSILFKLVKIYLEIFALKGWVNNNRGTH